MKSDEFEKIRDFSVSSHSISPLTGWQVAHELGYAVALWQLPRQKTKQLIINFGTEIPKTKIVLEDLPAGFAVSPFLNMEGHDSLFIEADLYFRFGEEGAILTESTGKSLSNGAREQWEIACGKRKESPKETKPSGFQTITSLPDTDYLDAVQKAIEAIEAGEMQKVVFSRTKQVELPPNFSLTEIFERLCQKYPTAFVSLVYLPQLDQVWLGATPETLVSVDKEGIFRTVSLAGTQSAFDAAGEPISVKQAAWTQKEIEEQALVSRYIISCFKKIRVREYTEEGPKTVVAGNLMHLRSDYAVDTKAINFPEIGTVMLELLHPTSAVCGMPKMAALNFIQANEGYEREFYSGFLGPVNVENETHLFVNLRCMKIQNGIATLYAGGGITEDSIPAKEWQETEMKCQTMLAVLN